MDLISILDKFISLVHYQKLYLLQTEMILLMEIKYSSYCPYNHIAATVFDSLNVRVQFVSTDEVAKA